MGVTSRRSSQRMRRKAQKEASTNGSLDDALFSSDSGSAAVADADVAEPTVPTQATPASGPALTLDHEEVVDAVRSLYDDELKPFGRILRKRVAERAAAASSSAKESASSDLDEHEDVSVGGATLPNVDMKQLRVVCDGCPALCVEAEEGGDWSVSLRGRQPNFVDVYDPEDAYNEELWSEVSKYFNGLAGTPSQFLPGGRYSCAQALVARRPAFLKGLSMGRVCHVVQLAISQKKILGYLNGAVVPYACSQSMMKEQRAERQLPYSKPTCEAQEMPFATLDAARECLKIILDTEITNSSNPASCNVPLSNVKRLFRSRFQLELSETMLGHSKLSELLQDERFSEVCSVKLAGHGYVVMPKEKSEETMSQSAFTKSPPGLSPLVQAPEQSVVPPPPGLLPPGVAAVTSGVASASQPPAPPPQGPPRLPPGLHHQPQLPPGLLQSGEWPLVPGARKPAHAPPAQAAPPAPPSFPASLAKSMRTVATGDRSSGCDLSPMKVPLPILQAEKAPQGRVQHNASDVEALPTLLGRSSHMGSRFPGDDAKPFLSCEMHAKLPSMGTPSGHQHDWHEQQQKMQQQKLHEHQLRQQMQQRIQQQRLQQQTQLQHQQMQQQLMKQHLLEQQQLQQQQRTQAQAANSLKRLLERGVDPAVAYSLASGKAASGAATNTHTSVAQLEPAISSMSSMQKPVVPDHVGSSNLRDAFMVGSMGSQQTLTLSELLPR